MKKAITLCLLFIFFFQTIDSSAATVQIDKNYESSNNVTESVTPRKDIIKWHYKSVNGNIYKRQYNHSKGKWIGSWKLV